MGKSEMGISEKSGCFQLSALRKVKRSPRIFLKPVFINNKNLCDLLKGSGSAIDITLVNNGKDKTVSVICKYYESFKSTLKNGIVVTLPMFGNINEEGT